MGVLRPCRLAARSELEALWGVEAARAGCPQRPCAQHLFTALLPAREFPKPSGL